MSVGGLRHREHLRRARRDAELAALAVSTSMVTVPRLVIGRVPHRTGSQTRASSQAGYAFGGQELEAGAQRSLVRLDVLAAVRRDRLPHRLDERVERTRPVSAQYAPIITIDAASALPTSVATLGRVDPVHRDVRARRSRSNVESFTTHRRRRAAAWPRRGSQNSSCIAIADHACDTTGGASIGPSATTTVLSVLPPRIMPP